MIVRARDVYGGPLNRRHTIWVDRLGSGGPRSKVARDVPPDGRAEFELAWQNDYRVRVVSEGHAEASANVGGSTEEVDVVVPVEPSAVVGFVWPVSPGPFPGVDFEDLDDQRRGTLLNIWAKIWATSFGVVPAGAYIRGVEEVRADRLICRVSPAIVDALELSDLDEVTSSVGHTPPDGYANGPSYKTADDVGNLQVSLMLPADMAAPMMADIDIDEERGYAHVFRAIGHHVTGSKTDPVEVQQILAAAGIDAGWRPVV